MRSSVGNSQKDKEQDIGPQIAQGEVTPSLREEVRTIISSMPIHVQAAAIYMMVENPVEFGKQFQEANQHKTPEAGATASNEHHA